MKRILASIASICILASNSIYADEYPFACEWNDIAAFNKTRYFEIAQDLLNPAWFIDTKTIKIDKKNKLIQVWMIKLSSQEGRNIMINSLGKYSDNSNYGYTKNLQILDYKNGRSRIKETANYNCDGSIISSTTNTDNAWDNIYPDSIGEVIVDRIIAKYKL